jgi:hypothetical protein
MCFELRNTFVGGSQRSLVANFLCVLQRPVLAGIRVPVQVNVN